MPRPKFVKDKEKREARLRKQAVKFEGDVRVARATYEGRHGRGYVSATIPTDSVMVPRHMVDEVRTYCLDYGKDAGLTETVLEASYTNPRGKKRDGVWKVWLTAPDTEIAVLLKLRFS
jgi:hypothetical protein